MTFLTGLKAIQELKDKAAAESNRRDFIKYNWFSLKNGETARVRFLQEIDQDSPNYDEEAGLARVVIQHQAPGLDGWKRKLLCTNAEDDGSPCLPCEIRKAQGWEAFPKKKSMLYVNVLVNPGEDNEEVAVLSQSLFGNGVVTTLLEYAGDEDLGGSITDREWKISRTGEGKDTRYTAVGYPAKGFKTKASDYELFDLSDVVPDIEYDAQERYLSAVLKPRDENPDAQVEEKTADKDFLGW